jgi:hypothetical protein
MDQASIAIETSDSASNVAETAAKHDLAERARIG